MKVCVSCKVEKKDEDFHRYSTSKDGLYPRCKTCRKLDTFNYYKNNKDKIISAVKQYRSSNLDKVKKSQKLSSAKFYISNKEKVDARNRAYFIIRPDKRKEYNKKSYPKRDKNKMKQKASSYYRKYINDQRDKAKTNSKHNVEKITDTYVRKLIAKEFGISAKTDVPAHILEAKRFNIQLKREIKNKKNA